MDEFIWNCSELFLCILHSGLVMGAGVFYSQRKGSWFENLNECSLPTQASLNKMTNALPTLPNMHLKNIYLNLWSVYNVVQIGRGEASERKQLCNPTAK